MAKKKKLIHLSRERSSSRVSNESDIQNALDRNQGVSFATSKGKQSVKRLSLTRGDSVDSLISLNSVRAIRQSTKEKTVEADVARIKAFKPKVRARPELKHQFSQKELLLDALKTEVCAVICIHRLDRLAFCNVK